MASLTKCQPSQVLALSDSLRASHWAMNAKALTLKSFISDHFLLGTLFSCHWSFPINSFHLAHLDCLCNHYHLPYMYFHTLHTNTHAQNPQIHSSEYTLAIPTERSPSRMQKAGWRSRFCMMNCVGALFALTLSLLLVCYLSSVLVKWWDYGHQYHPKQEFYMSLTVLYYWWSLQTSMKRGISFAKIKSTYHQM